MMTFSQEFHLSAALLDEQLCFALYSASSRLTSIYRPLLGPLGLTYTQFIVLMGLWEKDGINISQLAKRTGLSKATMTPLLKRLESKGMIQRQTLPDDERSKNIVLTDTGRQLSKRSKTITDQAFCATKLSSEQVEYLIRICQQIINPGVN